MGGCPQLRAHTLACLHASLAEGAPTNVEARTIILDSLLHQLLQYSHLAPHPPSEAPSRPHGDLGRCDALSLAPDDLAEEGGREASGLLDGCWARSMVASVVSFPSSSGSPSQDPLGWLIKCISAAVLSSQAPFEPAAAVAAVHSSEVEVNEDALPPGLGRLRKIAAFVRASQQPRRGCRVEEPQIAKMTRALNSLHLALQPASLMPTCRQHDSLRND